MLIIDVFNDQKATNVINDGVLVLRVVVHSVLVLSIVTDGMLKF
jgi:hypothetical protein